MESRIVLGDCLEVMKTMDTNCIDLTVTSPPYDNLRKYNGYTFDFEGIAKELYRITKNGGVVVWVVGDATINGSETGTSFKQALFFKEIGFNLYDTMIYYKPSVGGNRGNCRAYNQSFEYMFILSKGTPNTFNPIKDKYNKNAGKLVKFSSSSKRGATCEKDYKVCDTYAKRSNVWSIETAKSRNNGHPAVFPEKLAEDHIKTWSNEGDLVFDPMCGSGTTLKMAKLNKRRYLGIEISEEYYNIACKRVGCASIYA